jgi:hypothetical protein
MNCDSMQGFLLSRPLPPAEASEWLQRNMAIIPAQVGGARLTPRVA